VVGPPGTPVRCRVIRRSRLVRRSARAPRGGAAGTEPCGSGRARRTRRFTTGPKVAPRIQHWTLRSRQAPRHAGPVCELFRTERPELWPHGSRVQRRRPPARSARCVSLVASQSASGASQVAGGIGRITRRRSSCQGPQRTARSEMKQHWVRPANPHAGRSLAQQYHGRDSPERAIASRG